jgi:hypothetical protein
MNEWQALALVSVGLNLGMYYQWTTAVRKFKGVKQIIEHMKKNYTGPHDPIHLIEDQIDEL